MAKRLKLPPETIQEILTLHNQKLAPSEIAKKLNLKLMGKVEHDRFEYFEREKQNGRLI